MAKALLCPNCRARYPLDKIGAETSFPCEKCGQILKVPESLLVGSSNGGGTAVLGPPSADAQSDGAPGRSDRRRQKKEARSPRAEKPPKPPKPGRVVWPLRILAWLVALPLGAAIVYVPARRFDLITGVDLADVIIGTGNERYVRLAIVVVLWALVAAILVQLFLVGGRALYDRWRTRRARPGTPEPVADGAQAGPDAPRPVPAQRVPGRTSVTRAGSARSSQRLRNTAGRRTGS